MSSSASIASAAHYGPARDQAATEKGEKHVYWPTLLCHGPAWICLDWLFGWRKIWVDPGWPAEAGPGSYDISGAGAANMHPSPPLTCPWLYPIPTLSLPRNTSFVDLLAPAGVGYKSHVGTCSGLLATYDGGPRPCTISAAAMPTARPCTDRM